VANGSSEEAKEKIGKIVREIDKCITLLTRWKAVFCNGEVINTGEHCRALLSP
jgi:hypothetical protein